MRKIALLMVFAAFLSSAVASNPQKLCDLPADVPKPQECVQGLQYDILEQEIPGEVVDKDVFTPRVKLDTNAEKSFLLIGEEEHRLYDDGDHGDRGAGDGWYGNMISTGEPGTHDIRLKFKKGDQQKTTELESTEFLRTPPRPSVNVVFEGGNPVIEIETDFSKGTRVEGTIKIKSDEAVEAEKQLSLTCQNSCKRKIDSSLTEGDEVVVEASQSYRELESKETETSTEFTTDKSLSADYPYSSEQRAKLSQSSYWEYEIGISKNNFKLEDIQEVYLTSGGEKVGTVSDSEITEDDMLPSIIDTIFDLERPVYLRWSAKVEGSELPEGSSQIVFNAKLDSGEILKDELANLEVFEDTEPPTFEDISYSGNAVKFNIEENLARSVDYTVRDRSGNVLKQGTVKGRLREGKHTGKVNLEGLNPVTTVSVEASDPSGNSNSREYQVISQPDEAVEAVEENGNPRNKINLLVYGYRMDKEETVDKLERNLEVFFNEEDLSHIGKYRDYFNWYVVDTDKELCSTITGMDIEGKDCPTGREHMDRIISDSSVINNSRTGKVILDPRTYRNGEWIRSYASGGFTLVSEQDSEDSSDSGADPFTHELGHLIWGFDDEYGNKPAEESVMDDSYFFPKGMGDGFQVTKYPNTWKQRNNCVSNMTTYYAGLTSANCVPQGEGFRVGGDGASLMKESSNPRLYQNHERRITHLMEGPVYRGETQ
jgi:hypothetical protein